MQDCRGNISKYVTISHKCGIFLGKTIINKLKNILVAAVIVVGGTSIANAAVLKFEAISASAGSLGWLTMDDSVFNGSADQHVLNSNILSLSFTNPATLVSFGTADIATAIGFITRVDSSGITPTIIGGSGYAAINSTGYFWFVGASKVSFVSSGPLWSNAPLNVYDDVSWTTTTVSAVPLPAGGLLLLGGLGAIAALRRKKRALT